MTTLIDSHCHLDRIELSAFGGTLDTTLAEAAALDVKGMVCIGVDLESFPAVHAIAKQYQAVYASVGKHPTDTTGEEPDLDHLIQLGSLPKVIAIGETGLDYYREGYDAQQQQTRFLTHITAAKALHKPLVIHTRHAQEDTLAILRQEQVHHGIFHCFTESYAMAKAGIDLGLYISFSGIITFKNAQSLREVVQRIPLDAMLLETDAPYLTPIPFRGQPNFPGYTHYVAKTVAELKGVSYEEVAAVTTANAKQVFASFKDL